MNTILIADDNMIFRQVMEVTLKARGYATVAVTNGQEALDQMAQCSPDLLILDVAMPVMDGIAVLKQLRSDTRWATLPVILMTAMTERDCLDREPDLSVQACLTKSHFSLADMVKTIQSLLSEPPVRIAS
jgi:CheY-like chemotaxis protein